MLTSFETNKGIDVSRDEELLNPLESQVFMSYECPKRDDLSKHGDWALGNWLDMGDCLGDNIDDWLCLNCEKLIL